MGDTTATDCGKLYLERAEEVLFANFITVINDGEYDRAEKLLEFLERLSLV